MRQGLIERSWLPRLLTTEASLEGIALINFALVYKWAHVKWEAFVDLFLVLSVALSEHTFFVAGRSDLSLGRRVAFYQMVRTDCRFVF